MKLEEIRAELIRGDYSIIAAATGKSVPYVGQVLRGVRFNQKIIDTARKLAESRKQQRIANIAAFLTESDRVELLKAS